MRIHVIGLGGAGCRIANQFADEHGEQSFLSGVVAFDTDSETIASLESIAEDQRYRFGDEAGGTGFDGDLDRGVAAGTEHVDELSRVLDRGTPSLAEAFVLVVGLGGATGSGAAPALASNLNRLSDAPVYVLGVLPAAIEAEQPDSGIDAEYRPNAASNAQRTIDRLDGVANAIICFDNETWLRRGRGLAAERDRLNGVIVHRMATLFGSGDSNAGTPTAQQVIDASDVNRALGDESAVATIGYAEQPVETGSDSRFGLGLFSSPAEPDVDTSKAVSAIETVIRKAARGKQTLECVGEHADRTLLIVGGPPAWLNRQAIAQGRRWLADEVGSNALLSGDAPEPDGEAVYAVVLRSGVEPANWLGGSNTPT
ncbi:MAG: tubulin/FtsZ family protein [Halobacteriota archaeon]